MPRPASASGSSPGTIELLRTTPMRDVVRGRLTGRLDIPSAVADLGLPGAVASSIVRAVSKARTPALHKPALARMEGERARQRLDSGESAEAVLAEIGTGREAPRRMRRRHLEEFGPSRTRRVAGPIARRTGRYVRRVLRGLKWTVIMSLGAYAILCAWFFIGTPKIKRNFAAEWNAKVEATPVEDRAWPRLVEAIARRTEPGSLDSEGEWTDARPEDAMWPGVVRYLDENAEALEMVRQAAALPMLGAMMTDGSFPEMVAAGLREEEAASENPWVIDFRFDYLGQSRHASRWLKVDARAAADVGDGERALRDITAAMSLADLVRGHPTALADLASLSIAAAATDLVGDLLHVEPALWDASALERLQARVQGFANGERVVLRLDDRTALIDDYLQRLYTDNGRGDGRFTAAGFRNLAAREDPPETLTWWQWALAPMRGFEFPSRKELTDLRDRLHALAVQEVEALPWQHPGFESVDQGESILYGRAKGHPVERIVAWQYAMAAESSYWAVESFNQQRDATVAILAMHRYRAEHGAWPAALDDLVPGYLAEPPIDRVTGTPMRYSVVEGEPLLYTVGTDSDDDGGVPAYTGRFRSRSLYHRTDGDIVFWPPPPRLLEGVEPGPSPRDLLLPRTREPSAGEP